MDFADLTLGIDYGTDSVRAVIFQATGDKAGANLAEQVEHYPRWQRGEYCDPTKQQFRQHPQDYLDCLQNAVRGAIDKLNNNSDSSLVTCIKGIAIDTTGSTPVAVNRQGTPLALTPEFEHNPNAMFILWKDHTAVAEAEAINNIAHSGNYPDYTRYVGGTYSLEWFWSKILHIVRNDSDIRDAAFSWVEHCDWISAELSGDTDPLRLKRSRCAAGHKAMWHSDFDGLPSNDFWCAVDPLLNGLRDRLYNDTYTSDQTAGLLSQAWSERLGLPAGIPIAVGALDAHMGAVGAGIQPFSLVKVMGTSTCDMLVAPSDQMRDANNQEQLVEGICGQVDGSILPGMIGMEAGQSAFGDVYAWFKQLLLWPLQHTNAIDYSDLLDADSWQQLQTRIAKELLPELSRQAALLPVDSEGLVALDWLNGRRTPHADPRVKAAITGLMLGTDAPAIFKSLVEATAFGAKAINDCFIEQGIPIKDVIAIGGVANQSPLVMQTLANVLNMPIKVAAAEQACALGSAMMAAVVGGLYATVAEAQQTMAGGIEKIYHPQAEVVESYRYLFNRYKRLGSMNPI